MSAHGARLYGWSHPSVTVGGWYNLWRRMRYASLITCHARRNVYAPHMARLVQGSDGARGAYPPAGAGAAPEATPAPFAPLSFPAAPPAPPTPRTSTPTPPA